MEGNSQGPRGTVTALRPAGCALPAATCRLRVRSAPCARGSGQGGPGPPPECRSRRSRGTRVSGCPGVQGPERPWALERRGGPLPEELCT